MMAQHGLWGYASRAELQRIALGQQKEVAMAEDVEHRQVERLRFSWRLWLCWVLVTAWGLLVGSFVGGLEGGVVGGVLAGVLQWLMLRRHIPRAGWWVLATTLGLAAAGALSAGGWWFQSAGRWALGVEVGLIVGGVLQWVVLRRHVARAGWWVPATAASGALALAVGVSMGVSVFLAVGRRMEGLPGLYFATAVGQLLAIAVGGVLFGALTGLALRQLLRQPLMSLGAISREG
jgi:hypothetical protein